MSVILERALVEHCDVTTIETLSNSCTSTVYKN